MTNAAVFQATFSDFRLVKGRKQAQIIFEVPLEDADAALKALGGVPRPDESRWFAIARLVSDAQAEAPNRAAEGVEQIHKAARKRWNEMPASQRAAILCNDPEFQKWLGEKAHDWPDRPLPYSPEGEVETADARLKAFLGIISKRELDANLGKAMQFDSIRNQFLADTGRVASPER